MVIHLSACSGDPPRIYVFRLSVITFLNLRISQIYEFKLLRGGWVNRPDFASLRAKPNGRCVDRQRNEQKSRGSGVLGTRSPEAPARSTTLVPLRGPYCLIELMGLGRVYLIIPISRSVSSSGVTLRGTHTLRVHWAAPPRPSWPGRAAGCRMHPSLSCVGSRKA